MSALAVFALALWLCRLYGNVVGGVIITAFAYWMLAMLAIGIGAIAQLANL
jgi:hypothetical protein